MSEEYAFTPEELTEIRRDIEIDPGLDALLSENIANPESNDFKKIQDRTGLEMLASERAKTEAGGWERAALSLMGKDPGMHECAKCGSDVFRIMGSTEPGEAKIMIICGNLRCGAFLPPMEFSPAQMNRRLDLASRRDGLWVPGRN